MKLTVWATRVLAVSAGVMSAAGISIPLAGAIPAYHVADLPYGEAKAILDDQGVEVVDTVKHGNDLPLAQCIVTSYSFDGDGDLNGTGMILWLNCKKEE